MYESLHKSSFFPWKKEKKKERKREPQTKRQKDCVVNMPAHPGGSWWAAFGEQCWQWQGWCGNFWWGKFLLWWLCDLGTRQNCSVVQVLSLYSLSTTESGDQHVISLEAYSAVTKLLFSLGSVPDACHEQEHSPSPSLSSVTTTITIISHYHHHYHQSLSPPISSVAINITIISHYFSSVPGHIKRLRKAHILPHLSQVASSPSQKGRCFRSPLAVNAFPSLTAHHFSHPPAKPW